MVQRACICMYVDSVSNSWTYFAGQIVTLFHSQFERHAVLCGMQGQKSGPFPNFSELGTFVLRNF